MFLLRRKFFVYLSLLAILSFPLYPATIAQAKTINVGALSTDTVSIPGQILNGKLSGTGNRCLYVDSTGNVLVKGFDCGSATGGDNLGDHSATQNLKLNSFWLSGDGGNEGLFISSVGRVGVNNNAPGAELQISAPASTEGLRIVSASDYSPLNIRNSANSADIFRVDQAGSLAVGSIPWSRLSSFPSACSAGQYVSAVGTTLTCSSPATGADIYWTGTATNLNAATGRTSLGLGSLATQSSVSDAQVPNDITIDYASSAGTATALAANGANCSAGYYPLGVNASGAVESCTAIPSGSDIYWTGTATNLNAATGRTSLGLGSLATLSSVTTTQISNGTIVDADISSSAAISASKVQNGTYFINSAGTSGQVWKSDGSGAGAWGSDDTGIDGSGTLKYLSRFSGSKALENSIVYDDGTNIGVNTINPGARLDVNGSFRNNSSVTFSSLAGGGTRMLTVDNAGTLGATAVTSLPSGSTNQTLRYDGSAWAASSLLTNSSSLIGVNYNNTVSDAGVKLAVNGTIMSPSVIFTTPTTFEVQNKGTITYTSGNHYLNFTDADAYNFDSIVNSSTGFAYNGTVGHSFSYASDAVMTGLVIWGGIVVDAKAVTGATETVRVRNYTNTGYCSMVFTKGVFQGSNCP